MARLPLVLAAMIGVLLTPALPAAPAALAAGPDATRAALARQMRAAGPSSGALVVDLDSGRELYASRPDTPRIPASVAKLYTTATALLRFGPEGHLTTTVAGSAAPADGGVLEDDLYLRGGGDPTFGTTGAARLARAVVARAGLTRVTGRVIGDESAFDSRRGPPSSGFRTSGYVGPLSALTFNRGRTGVRAPYFQPRPALFAAQAFHRALRSAGVKIGTHATAGRAPAGVTTLAEASSPDIETLATLTNRPSDNFLAETLIKAIGHDFGAVGSTAGGAAVIRRAAAALGSRPRVVDGSGLSRGNRTTPRDVVALLSGMTAEAPGAAFRGSLAVVGRHGTLTYRMRGTAAQGRCQAKTGTLSSVSALAGYCRTASGANVAFAFLMNGVNPAGARSLQDRMTVALARYSAGAPAASSSTSPSSSSTGTPSRSAFSSFEPGWSPATT